MLLHKLEAMLHELYALEVGYAVSDFLITDAELARTLDAGGRKVDEKLLIAEADGEADVALYLERELLERLTQQRPADAPRRRQSRGLLGGARRRESFHVLRVERGQRDKSVSLFELELQAEVDKFVTTGMLLRDRATADAAACTHWLFDAAELDRPSSTTRSASAIAARTATPAKYCRRARAAARARRRRAAAQRELRRFYRLSQARSSRTSTRPDQPSRSLRAVCRASQRRQRLRCRLAAHSSNARLQFVTVNSRAFG